MTQRCFLTLFHYIHNMIYFNNIKLMFSNTQYAFLGICPKESKNYLPINTYTFNVHNSIIHNLQEGERIPNVHQLINE